MANWFKATDQSLIGIVHFFWAFVNAKNIIFWIDLSSGNTLEHHAFELFLSIEGIEHTVTKAYSPQTNGICERFHKTMKNEFYDTAMRKKRAFLIKCVNFS